MGVAKVFERERLTVGETTTLEYGVYHAGRGQWISFQDGAACFVDAPIPLAALFPKKPDAGTASFAFRLLDWLRQNAGTGEVKGGLWVPFQPEQVKGCGVFAFEVAKPLVVETDIEIEDLRAPSGRDIILQVRGPKDGVDRWVLDYARRYPPQVYRSSFVDHPAEPGQRMVRVTRRRDDGQHLPFGSLPA